MTQLLTETKHPSARCQVMAPSSGEQNCGSPMKHYNNVHGTRAVVRSGYLPVRWYVPGTYYVPVRWYVAGTYLCGGTYRVPTRAVVRSGYLLRTSAMVRSGYLLRTSAMVRSGYLRVRWHVPGTYLCGGTLRVPTRAVGRCGYLPVRWYVPCTYSCDGTFRVPTHEVVRPGYLPVRWYMPSVCPISCSSSVTYASRLYLIFSSAYARDVHSELYSANATKLFVSKNVSKLTTKRDEIQRDSTRFNEIQRDSTRFNEIQRDSTRFNDASPGTVMTDVWWPRRTTRARVRNYAELGREERG